MDIADNAKVIPFSPVVAQAGAAGDDRYGLALSRRRGLDSVEPALRPRTVALPSGGSPDMSPTPRERLDAPALSAMFIASLDDQICQRSAAWPLDMSWPKQADRQLETVAIDIVDMLFGFIVENPELSACIKEALLPAQLPTLRMATQEMAFFADWQHPARRFLNDIAPLARTFVERGGRVEAFATFMAGAIGRMLEELTPNGNSFATVHTRLREFVDGSVVVSAPAGAAWQRAEAAARRFLERPLPQVARDFVAAHWIDVLQHTAERYAEDSPQWQDALAVVEDLAWSLLPKCVEEDRCRLIAMVPALLTRLNRGLDLIELPREDRRPFFDALIEIHAAALRVETGQPVLQARYESATEQVARLQRGDWVEFQLDDGSRSRERLTWISPQRGILVFSNRLGQRAIQISPEDLADLVREHRATLIFDAVVDAGRNSA